MPLLIDSDIVEVADLLEIDSEVLDVADAEDLVLTGPRSILRLNWNQCSAKVLRSIQAFGGDIIAWPGTLTTYGAFGVSRPRFRLNQLLTAVPYAERQSALHIWMTYRALTVFYRAAANHKDKDRYETKWERFEKETGEPWIDLASTGFPYVALPLARPGALHEYNSSIDAEVAGGYFGPANVTAVAGGANAQAAYDVCITWVDQTNYVSPQLRQNAESAPSTKITSVVPVDQLLQVNLTGLIPPSAQQAMLSHGIADGPYLTRSASGWNVYVGPAGAATLALQNSAPIPLTTATFTMPGAPAAPNAAFMQTGQPAIGAPLLPGQFADSNYAYQNHAQRG